MTNPGGNYPGRQIIAGVLDDCGEPGMLAFAYLVTGRSLPSKERFLEFDELANSVRVKPIDPRTKFDPFRHYQAVLINPRTSNVIISNSEAPNAILYEALELGYIRKLDFSPYLEGVLASIGPEFDNTEKPTPRIVCCISPNGGNDTMFYYGITTRQGHAKVLSLQKGELDNGMVVLQTYNGDVEYESFCPSMLGKIKFTSERKSAEDLAKNVYEITDFHDPRYCDLRSCAVAGIYNSNGPGGWEIARKNRYSVK